MAKPYWARPHGCSVSGVPRLADVLAAVDGWYPQRDAESWDAVGLVCGDLQESVTRVLLAIDAVPATVAQARSVGAQLLLTHHPLLMTPVHGVPVTDPKGALVHAMIRAGLAHFVAHTNAEINPPGVSDALAGVLGLRDVEPLLAIPDPPLDKITVFVPRADSEAMVAALSAAGAGRLGNYDRCAFVTEGRGTFRPGVAAVPAMGRVGEVATVDEARIEMVLIPDRRAAVVAAMRQAHPYEEPAFDLVTHTALPGRRGVGRVGTLPEPSTLAGFTGLVASTLPATSVGVRAAGDPTQRVERVAVLGGSGSSVVDSARSAGADVLLTADLKHHNAVEAVTQRSGTTPMALVDAAHWATEVPWLALMARRLRAEFGDTVDAVVSDVVTDPWALHVPSAGIDIEIGGEIPW